MRLNALFLLISRPFVSIRRATLGILFGGVLGLSACVSYAPQPLILAEQSDLFLQKNLADEGLRSFLESQTGKPLPAWPLESWDLSTLTLAAFYFHPELSEARAEWEAAAAMELDARRLPNPSLGLGAGYNATMGIPSPWILTSLLDLKIETGGKRAARSKSAHQDAEIARLHVASVAWYIRDRVRSQMIELSVALEASGLLTKRLELQQEFNTRIEQQYEAGMVSLAEHIAVKSETDEVVLATQGAKWRAEDATLRLTAALGLPEGALVGRPIHFESLWSAPGDEAMSSEEANGESAKAALFNRSDLLLALAEYAKSEAELRLQVANQYPDISLGPGFEYDQGDNKWSLGTGFNIPLFNRNHNKITAAEATRRAAAARFEGVQIKVLKEVALAEAGFRFATQNLAIADSLTIAFERTEHLASSKWESGELSKTELIALQLQMNVRAFDRLSTRAEYLRALSDLENALQSPVGFPNTFELGVAPSQNGSSAAEKDESKANKY